MATGPVFDEVTVTVNPAGPVDQPPVVNAGTDQTITLPASANLDGTVTDDGLSTLTTLWSATSGPGTVTFGNASLVDTTASFSVDGSYVLRLTATDGTGPVFDEVTVTVNPAVSTDVIFADGFESGNFSAWSAVVDAESDLSVSPGAALVGSSGMAALIDNTTGMYVQDDTPASEASYRARFYFDPNSITMADGNLHFIFTARNTTLDVVRIDFPQHGWNLPDARPSYVMILASISHLGSRFRMLPMSSSSTGMLQPAPVRTMVSFTLWIGRSCGMELSPLSITIPSASSRLVSDLTQASTLARLARSSSTPLSRTGRLISDPEEWQYQENYGIISIT